MKRTICGLLAAAALSLPAGASRVVPVQVDGLELTGDAYLIEGVTYVPLRYLMEALGDWEVTWDSEAGQAVAVSEKGRITAAPDADTITINGETYDGKVTVARGRTYVPLRRVMEALGGSAEWDPYLSGAAVTSPDAVHDAADLYWLSRIINAESGGEPLEGQIAVGNVVLNRVASEQFPDNIPDVVFDRVNAVQFEPVENGTVYNHPTAQSVEAAIRVLEGENTIGEAMYFYAPALSQGIWINANRPYHKTIGCHRFYL